MFNGKKYMTNVKKNNKESRNNTILDEGKILTLVKLLQYMNV